MDAIYILGEKKLIGVLGIRTILLIKWAILINIIKWFFRPTRINVNVLSKQIKEEGCAGFWRSAKKDIWENMVV